LPGPGSRDNKDAAELSAASIFLSGPTIFRLILAIKFSHHSDGFTIPGFAQAGVSSDDWIFALLFFSVVGIKRSSGFSVIRIVAVFRIWTQLGFLLGCRIFWFFSGSGSVFLGLGSFGFFSDLDSAWFLARI
jgi:hypothetical protein